MTPTFDRDLGVLACKHVLDGERPVEVVFHSDDDGWQFLCGDDHSSLPPTAFEIVCIWHLIERQPELARMATLEAAWMAQLDSCGRWVRSPA